MKKIIFAISTVLMLALASCGGDDNGSTLPETPPTPEQPGKPDTPTTPTTPTDPEAGLKPRYIWIDAAANFPRYANSQENIKEDLQKVKDAGFTDIVVDVRPSMGDVLYQTNVTEPIKKLDVWENGQYKYFERTATWDYLQAFIDEGHALGLKVNAAFNTFVGGCLYPYGLGQQGAVFRDADKKAWVTTVSLKRGLVNEMDLTSTDPSNAEFYGTKFLNPCNDDVQIYLLKLLRDLSKYDVDGIFLDRCRYDDLRSDFSPETQRKFKEYVGNSNVRFPDDVGVADMDASKAASAKYYKEWLAFRAKTIYDFVKKAVSTVHGVNSKIKVGTYVGAWYSTYYEVGVNWASRKYNPAVEYPSWANADYQKYGYADQLDFMLLGCYAGAANVYGGGEWTMQGFASLSKRLLCNAVKFAGGPDVGNPSGFENGGQHEAVKNSVDACINAADGYFVFDICHVVEYNYWKDLKEGIDKYKSSVKK